jgi:hypothetical protein
LEVRSPRVPFQDWEVPQVCMVLDIVEARCLSSI